MKFEELLKDKDFIKSTNLELIMFRFLEALGVRKEDILSGQLDLHLGKMKDAMIEMLNYESDGQKQ